MDDRVIEHMITHPETQPQDVGLVMALMDEAPRVLLVAERFNVPWKDTYERWEALARGSSAERERWLDVSRRCSCFNEGTGRAKLDSIGACFTHALNLLPPNRACGDWDAPLAKAVADELRLLIVTAHDEVDRFDPEEWRYQEWRFDKLILVGKRVAAAMELGHLDFFETHGGCVIVPHPSGRNLWWNDAANVARGRVKMEEFLR